MHPTLPTQALPELPSGVYEKLFSDPYLPKGALVHASPGADGQVLVYHLKSSYTYTLEDFQGQFHHLPDGEEKLSQHTNLLLQDIQTTTREIMALSEQLHQAQPSINRQTGQSEGLDHLPIPRDALKNTKGTLLAVNQKVESLKEDLGRKRETMEGLMRQRMAQAEAALVPIREMVTKLEEAVWTVELYTGRHEEIVQLLDGPPAPASTPISIRQQVLAMDEEAAVAAETGGIDSLSVEDFDQWIQADPSHLQQILPEVKGVVALVPRWKDKHHQDSYLHEKAREGNKRTYFLIRNGSRVYRICTDFFADQTLTPTATEFLDLFRRFDHFKNEYRQMEPGSRDYMEAEKKRDRRQRDYMRVALILQGLIDRTVVFHPLPDQGVMVTDPSAYQEGLVEIIADAERSLLDGSERFQDFQARINEDLEPGRRIMGNFGYNFSRLRDDHDRRHPRLHPDRAESPDSYTLHTLDRRDRNQLVFLYERKDPIWLAGQGYVKAERRASCRIRPTDTFVLAFDHPEGKSPWKNCRGFCTGAPSATITWTCSPCSKR
ncbi:hypothetical protein [Deinococcus roseus]|uniref:Uncharacterized protein n=1 Tax=Deinococcus roseus TaxID=392414 RepID=A0ABQ2D3F9_9DEIO|nr:hypothetical protein [Deinococcus roseus]GGJ44629.1 hypothetical protein GCM10008938_33500 [Deinococcus roseus]